jgi:hypothetical protein
MGNAKKVSGRFPFLLMAAFAAVAIVALVSGTRPVTAARNYVDVHGGVVNGGLTAEEQIQRQIEQTGRLMKDLPSPSELKQVRVNFDRDEIDAVDQTDKASTPLKIGLVKAMTPAIEVSGLDRGAANSPRQGTAGEALRTRDGGFVWAASVS